MISKGKTNPFITLKSFHRLLEMLTFQVPVDECRLQIRSKNEKQLHLQILFLIKMGQNRQNLLVFKFIFY